MAKLVVILRSGEERTIDASEGHSVMEILRDNAIDEIPGTCGGAGICGTCHVFIDAAFMSELPRRAREEEDLLDGLSHRTERSRLACQIAFVQAMDGLKLAVAPEE